MIGLEIRLKWAAIVDGRLRKDGLGGRVRALNADAREELARLRPDASIAPFFLHFPDPWWKKRHEKRLVMGPALLDCLARLLVDGGELFVQTDVEERAARSTTSRSARTPRSSRRATRRARRASPRTPTARASPREHHAIADGLPVSRLLYRRRPRQAGGAPLAPGRDDG